MHVTCQKWQEAFYQGKNKIIHNIYIYIDVSFLSLKDVQERLDDRGFQGSLGRSAVQKASVAICQDGIARERDAML